MIKKEEIVKILQDNTCEVDNFNDAVFDEQFDNVAEEILRLFNMPSLHTFKERRDKLNLSLRQVAKETGVSAATISRIERNKGLCSYHNVAMLDAFYNKKYREILNANN